MPEHPAEDDSHTTSAAILDDTTQRLLHTATGALDDEVMAIYRHCRDNFPPARPTWIAGIQNSLGDIYRMVIFEGLAQAGCFIERLQKMGYRQVSGDMNRITSALDAVFIWDQPGPPA